MKKLLILIFLFTSSQLWAEEAPEPEYPYPKTIQSDGIDVEKPKTIDNRGGYHYDTKSKKKKKKPYNGIEQPTHVNSDGSYYYGDDKNSDKLNSYDGVEKPIDKDSDGSYYYSREKKDKKIKAPYGPKPSRVTDDGAYVYNTKVSETKNTFYFRGGVYGPPDFKAASGASGNYEDVYGNDSSLVITLEYDWKLTNTLFIKAGSGISTTSGEGQFAGGANPGVDPKESFTFFVFPTTASIMYKGQIWNSQYFTPYVEAGAGYFAFMESRSDGDLFSFGSDTTKLGGAFVATATGGLLISLSKLQSGTTMLSDYGATQFWFDLQYKQILGLDSRKDFSSNMITGGFAIGF